MCKCVHVISVTNPIHIVVLFTQSYNKIPIIIVIFVSTKMMVMGLNFSFFKTPKHRVFNYQPLYYDERKEALQEKIARAREQEQGKEREYIPGRNIRANFRKSFYESRRQAGSPTLMRIIVLLSLLGLMTAAYYVAKSFGLFFI